MRFILRMITGSTGGWFLSSLLLYYASWIFFDGNSGEFLKITGVFSIKASMVSGCLAAGMAVFMLAIDPHDTSYEHGRLLAYKIGFVIPFLYSIYQVSSQW